MQIYLACCIEAAIKAGHEIFEIYNSRHLRLTVEIKANLSPLTNADKNSHRIIVETLQKTELPVLSEEGEPIDYEIRKDWEKFWLIDPLDGTKEFLKRNGEFTVNIALIDRCKATLGVIYAPVTGELYWGGETIGAWKTICRELPANLDDLYKGALRLPGKSKSKHFRIVASRSFKTPETQSFIEQLQSAHKKIEYVSVGSSLKICMVAEGKADIYPRLGPTMEWDTAAGHAVASAAGKTLTLTDRVTPLIYNKQELTNPYFIVS